MSRLIDEIEAVRNRGFKLDFRIPTMAELEKMRTIHRELTAAERAGVEKAEKGLKTFLEAVQRGDLDVDSLPLDLRTKLAKLMVSPPAEDDDL